MKYRLIVLSLELYIKDIPKPVKVLKSRESLSPNARIQDSVFGTLLPLNDKKRNAMIGISFLENLIEFIMIL